MKNLASYKPRKCKECGEYFVPNRKDKIYCKKLCATAASRRRRRKSIRAWHKNYYHSNEKRRQDKLKSSRERALKLKLETFDAYGGRICAGCGETELVTLSLDRINGGGTKHRERCKGRVYLDLKKKGYPSGYRVLCMNCQFRARFNVPFPKRKDSGE
jgi:hypothetical protein